MMTMMMMMHVRITDIVLSLQFRAVGLSAVEINQET